MEPTYQRVRGRVVPPPAPSPVTADDAGDHVDDLIVLCFDPPLAQADFQAFAAAHGLAHRPTEDEPQLFASADDVEVAYGRVNRWPLPEVVTELLLCGGAAPRPHVVVALARAMLAAWPHASCEARLPAELMGRLAAGVVGREGRGPRKGPR